MRILIIDDDKISGKQTAQLIAQCTEKAIVAGNFNSITNAKNWLQQNPKPDLIISETTFEDGSIFDLSKEINFKCPIILATNQKHHALDAFKLNTIAYVLKPLSTTNLKKAIDKFFLFKNIFSNEQIQHTAKERFAVSLGNKMNYITIEDISFFFAEDKTVYLHVKNGSRYVVDYTLDKLEKQISSKLFFRINRQVLAKIEAILTIKKHHNRRLQLSLSHGNSTADFIVSRTKVKAFKQWIGA